MRLASFCVAHHANADCRASFSGRRPQRELLSYVEIRILRVKKIKPAVVTSTGDRFVFSKSEGGERASIVFNPNTNDNVILVAGQLMSGDNYSRNFSH